MTRDELVAALLVERYGHIRRQWKGPYGVPADWQDVPRRRAEAAEVADEFEMDERESR